MHPTTKHNGLCEKQLTLTAICGKWKMPIISYLAQEGPQRFTKLHGHFSMTTKKMLVVQLRELEADGIVHREVFPVVPSKVEYSLTELGKKLLPILALMYEWGKEYSEACQLSKG